MKDHFTFTMYLKYFNIPQKCTFYICLKIQKSIKNNTGVINNQLLFHTQDRLQFDDDYCTIRESRLVMVFENTFIK